MTGLRITLRCQAKCLPPLPAGVRASFLSCRAGEGMISTIGRWVRASFDGVGSVSRFAVSTARDLPEARTWAPFVTSQARLLGVDSLPIAVFIAVFTGIVLSLLASYTFTGAVPLYFVGTL